MNTSMEIHELQEELRIARAEAAHWRANHDAQVARARFLIERGDLPAERVRAYHLMGSYHEALQRAASAAGLPAGADVTKELVPQIWLFRELLWNAHAFAENVRIRLPFHDTVGQHAALSTDAK